MTHPSHLPIPIHPYLPHLLTLSVQIDYEVLKNVHVCRVGDGTGGRSTSLAVDVSNRLRPHIEHKCVHQRYIVLITWLTGHLWYI